VIDHSVKAVDVAEGRSGSGSVSSSLLGVLACLIVVWLFLVSSEQYWHWFVIPVTLCGIIISGDAVDWARGRVHLLDPIGLLGVLGIYFFFLAPLLHVRLDYWMRYVVGPDDWRPWLGQMALLNAAGLLLYRLGSRTVLGRTPTAARREVVWRLNPNRFFNIAILYMVLAAAVQVFVYARYGGISGYVASAESTARQGEFAGMGGLFLISDLFPVFVIMAFVVYAKSRGRSFSLPVIAAIFLISLILLLIFGGLRGSRSATLWALIIGAGTVHLWVRPFSRRFVMLGIGFLVGFLYIYGFYKGAGIEGLQAVLSAEDRAVVIEETGRSFDQTLLGDLGRSDVQAFLLYRLSDPESDYEYALGRTYIGGATVVIPQRLLPSRPPTKVREGTLALYGADTFVPGERSSSRIYGLSGEAMLNFGPYAVPVAFLLLGVVVGSLSRFVMRLDRDDARNLLVPILVVFALLMLTSDSDNLSVFLLKRFAIPLAVVFLASERVILSRRAPVVSVKPKVLASPAATVGVRS
jgi:hypothetical protein